MHIFVDTPYYLGLWVAMETNMLSADHSVYTLIIRNPSIPDLFSICLKTM